MNEVVLSNGAKLYHFTMLIDRVPYSWVFGMYFTNY